MPTPPSLIWGDPLAGGRFQVDPALVQPATYRFDPLDRAFVDSQIRGLQTHLVQSVVGGVMCTWMVLNGASAPGRIGLSVCLAGTASPTITAATAAALAAAGSALGVLVSAGAPGAWVRVAIAGTLAAAVAGFGPAAGFEGATRLARVNPATGALEIVGSISSTDYPMGSIDAAGNLTLRPGALGAGSGAGGAAAPVAWSAVVTAGGNLTPAREQWVLADTTGGAFNLNVPGAPSDGDILGVKWVAGTNAFHLMPVALGVGLEDPANPGHYTSPLLYSVLGVSNVWKFSSNRNAFLLERASAPAAGGGAGASTGLSSARPAPTGSGLVYFNDDVGLISVDDPSTVAWKNYGIQGRMKTPPLASALTVVGTKLNLAQLGDAILALVSGSGGSQNVAVMAFPGGMAAGPWVVTCQGTFTHATRSGYPEFGVCVANGIVAGTSTAYTMCRYAYTQGWTATHEPIGDAQGGRGIVASGDSLFDELQGSAPLRMRLVSDGVLLIYQISADGHIWRFWASEALPASIGYFGIFVGTDFGSGVSGAIVQSLDASVMPQGTITNVVSTDAGSTWEVSTAETMASLGILSGMQLSVAGVVGSSLGGINAVHLDGCVVTGSNSVRFLGASTGIVYASGGKLTNISL